jgi:hypothetical protein
MQSNTRADGVLAHGDRLLAQLGSTPRATWIDSSRNLAAREAVMPQLEQQVLGAEGRTLQLRASGLREVGLRLCKEM